jgi:hypothetical protein
MSDAAPSPEGRPTARHSDYALTDRLTVVQPFDAHDSNRPTWAAPSANPVDYSGLNDPGAPDAGRTGDAATAPRHRWGYERGGYGGSASTIAAERDAADLTDLSHSLGDGARYAVDVGHARGQAETPAARAAKLRLRQALQGVRRVCEQAMRQRMHTEMADLASQIRKMHDRDTPQR